ncbi:efflux RND transporter permease subunit [Aquimarina celericrescens]|uniref:Efflux RND transporter permease subunit n=1 Tax=Aquimarina celericrescens TaxID=1964542 RepID=A0ABW5AYE1_9FLAO|nr:efflux RND transporter permease subunit [Aquimarina celericrescens]
MLKTFIDRPVFSTVISIIIVILGILGLQNLPVTQYPQIAPPTVVVRTTFPGASATTILESVITPLEEQINGVEGMDYITSTASNDGSAEITVYFNQGEDPDIAAVNVQNRVARANPLLPAEVLRTGVVTQKRENSALMYLSFMSTTNKFSDTFVQNYLNINVTPVIQRINGVGEVTIFGDKTYAIRIWLKPDKMAAYGLEPADIILALNEQSVEAAPGAIGQNSGQAFEYVIQYKGRYSKVDEYEDIILKTLDNNRFLTLKEVAAIELDASSYVTLSRTDGVPSVNMGIFQSPGSNASEVITEVKNKLESLKTDFPKGMKYQVNYNIDDFLSASINNLLNTFILAFLLVFIVVFIFLQDIRTTLIPAIAVPVSIVGTFFFLNLLGYSINLLTLFALILAIGIVVDDAIVVTEAIKSKLESGAKNAKKASISAMNEIAGAIISTTLVMAAVFIPVTFLVGPIGIFFEQFGVTLIIAILISSLNALTLSPALSALFLKPPKDDNGKKNVLQRFFSGFNSGFEHLKKRYGNSVLFLGKHRWISAVVILSAITIIYFLNKQIPKGFVPTEDRSIVFVNITLPPGSSLDRTFEITEEFYSKASKVKGIKSISLVVGSSFFAGAGGSYALGFIPLEDWSKREADSLSVSAITNKLFGIAATIPGAKMVFFQPPQIPGFGNAGGFAFNVLNEKGATLEELDQVSQKFMRQLMQQKPIQFSQSSFSTQFPQYQLKLDVPKIKTAGMQVDQVLETLQGYIGGIYAADFSRFGKQYRVYVQSLPQDRSNIDDFNQIFIRNKNGETSPISEYFTLERMYGPQSVNRFNLFTSVGVNGAVKPGFSSGDAITEINKLALSLPRGFSLGFGSLTREQLEAAGQLSTIFILSLIFIYFFLAAQYESYVIPFAVLLSLPLGLLGSYLFSWIFGLQNNIYFQIALIMLVGLLAKNAILIVEFGLQKRRSGKSIIEAGLEAAKTRLRPVIMTSAAFIAGMVPLIIASGVGAKGNQSIGTGAAGGLFVGTLLLIFFVPVLFMVFQSLHEKIVGAPKTSNENTEGGKDEN